VNATQRGDDSGGDGGTPCGESGRLQGGCANVLCCSFGFCAYSCFGGCVGPKTHAKKGRSKAKEKDGSTKEDGRHNLDVTPGRSIKTAAMPCTPIPGMGLADALDRLALVDEPSSPPFTPLRPVNDSADSPIKPQHDGIHVIQVNV
jgi:hypothetical protein